mmetsp:Transcript_10797/g.27822  ORF Transcript_10797/g.27822 Transcript_10797/m.27822 type:complete len:435 (-) Transcript_10797:1393-2697(-)
MVDIKERIWQPFTLIGSQNSLIRRLRISCRAAFSFSICARRWSHRSLVVAAILSRSSKSTQNSLRSSCSSSGAMLFCSMSTRSFLRSPSASRLTALRAARASAVISSSSSPACTVFALCSAVTGSQTGNSLLSRSSTYVQRTCSSSSSSSFFCESCAGARLMSMSGRLHSTTPSAPPVDSIRPLSVSMQTCTTPPLYGLWRTFCTLLPPLSRSGLCRMEPSMEAEISHALSRDTDKRVTNCSWPCRLSVGSLTACFTVGKPWSFGSPKDFSLPSAKPMMTESLEAEATAEGFASGSVLRLSFADFTGHVARASSGVWGSWSRGGAWHVHMQGHDSAPVVPTTTSLGGTSDSPLKSLLWNAMSSMLPFSSTKPAILTRGSLNATERNATVLSKSAAATYMLLPAWLMHESFATPALLMRRVSSTCAFFQSEQSTM